MKTIDTFLIPLCWDVNMTTCVTIRTRVGDVKQDPIYVQMLKE